jgi:hypothetical protein
MNLSAAIASPMKSEAPDGSRCEEHWRVHVALSQHRTALTEEPPLKLLTSKAADRERRLLAPQTEVRDRPIPPSLDGQRLVPRSAHWFPISKKRAPASRRRSSLSQLYGDSPRRIRPIAATRRYARNKVVRGWRDRSPSDFHEPGTHRATSGTVSTRSVPSVPSDPTSLRALRRGGPLR